MEEENSESANEEFDDDLKKMLQTMSGLNIEHGRTLNLCYGEYFHQKVEAFEKVEQHIGSFVQSFTTKASEFNDVKLSQEVSKEREECLFNTKENFDYVRTDGFGIDRDYKSINRTTAPAQTKPPSGDNFCDFILQDSSDDGAKIIGYGMAETSELCSNHNFKSPKAKNCDVFPIQTAEVNSYPCYFNSNIPPRLRFKRHVAWMVQTKPVSSSEGDSEDPCSSSETTVKRKREI